MGQNDMLSALLDDPEKLQSALNMASSLMGGGAPAPKTASTEVSVPSADPAAELMQKAMPVLAAIARSGEHAVNPDKKALLQAIKPFVSAEIGAQIDHGMRLVSMARMARSAMQQLNGSTPESEVQHV